MVLQLDPNLDLKSVTHVRAHLLPMSPAFTLTHTPTLILTSVQRPNLGNLNHALMEDVNGLQNCATLCR